MEPRIEQFSRCVPRAMEPITGVGKRLVDNPCFLVGFFRLFRFFRLPAELPQALGAAAHLWVFRPRYASHTALRTRFLTPQCVCDGAAGLQGAAGVGAQDQPLQRARADRRRAQRLLPLGRAQQRPGHKPLRGRRVAPRPASRAPGCVFRVLRPVYTPVAHGCLGSLLSKALLLLMSLFFR